MSDSKLIMTTTLVGTHVCISEKDHDLLIMAANTCKYTEERTKQLQAQVSDMSEVVETAKPILIQISAEPIGRMSGMANQSKRSSWYSKLTPMRIALEEALSKLNSNTAAYKRENGDKVKVGLLADDESLKAKIIGLQEESSAFRCANETLLKTSLNQEKENVDLKERLKNCLNHDSLIATRSELNKKDAAIANLQKQNNYFEQSHLTALQNINDLYVEIASLQNSRKELIKDVATEFYYHWHNSGGTNTVNGFDSWWKINSNRFLVNKELDDGL